MQGMGWTCLEELVWGDEDHTWLPPGVLHTRGPGTPPIPDKKQPSLLSLLNLSPCNGS